LPFREVCTVNLLLNINSISLGWDMSQWVALHHHHPALEWPINKVACMGQRGL